MKKSTLYGFIIMAMIVGMGFVMVKPGASSGTSVTGAAVVAGGIQQVVLGMQNYNYNPSTIKVKAGQPVSLSADASVQGCFRDLVVRGTDVRKYLRTPSDTIDFTIDTPGTYRALETPGGRPPRGGREYGGRRGYCQGLK